MVDEELPELGLTTICSKPPPIDLLLRLPVELAEDFDFDFLLGVEWAAELDRW